MFEKFERSFRLIAESFGILKKDKELLLFPIVSAFISILVIVAFVIPLFLGVLRGASARYFWFMLFILYFILYFFSVFFTAGIIGAANIRLRGGDPKFSDGIKIAIKNIHRLFLWALIAGTVGILIRALRGRRGNIIGSIMSFILKAAWEIITFFVIPVIILEKKGIKDSAKRSLELFRKAWGEEIIGQFSIGAIFAVAALLGFIPLLLAFFSGSMMLTIIVLIVLVFYWVALMILSSTLSGIYKAALYNYAAGNKVKFSDEFLRNAFVAKKKK